MGHIGTSIDTLMVMNMSWIDLFMNKCAMLDKLMYSGRYDYREIVSSYARNHTLLFDWQFSIFKRRHQLDDK